MPHPSKIMTNVGLIKFFETGALNKESQVLRRNFNLHSYSFHWEDILYGYPGASCSASIFASGTLILSELSTSLD